MGISGACDSVILAVGYREENITIAFRKNLTITDIIKRTMGN